MKWHILRKLAVRPLWLVFIARDRLLSLRFLRSSGNGRSQIPVQQIHLFDTFTITPTMSPLVVDSGL